MQSAARSMSDDMNVARHTLAASPPTPRGAPEGKSLRDPRAVRERCRLVQRLGGGRPFAAFHARSSRLADVAAYVAAVTRESYPALVSLHTAVGGIFRRAASTAGLGLRNGPATETRSSRPRRDRPHHRERSTRRRSRQSVAISRTPDRARRGAIGRPGRCEHRYVCSRRLLIRSGPATDGRRRWIAVRA